MNRKRQHLTICGVFIDGVWVDDLDIVKEEFRSFYKDIFSRNKDGGL